MAIEQENTGRPDLVVISNGLADLSLSAAFKRTFDVGVALAGLVLLSPLLLIVALAIKLEFERPRHFSPASTRAQRANVLDIQVSLDERHGNRQRI